MPQCTAWECYEECEHYCEAEGDHGSPLCKLGALPAKEAIAAEKSRADRLVAALAAEQERREQAEQTAQNETNEAIACRFRAHEAEDLISKACALLEIGTGAAAKKALNILSKKESPQ